jgi:hypothetical protein
MSACRVFAICVESLRLSSHFHELASATNYASENPLSQLQATSLTLYSYVNDGQTRYAHPGLAKAAGGHTASIQRRV